MRFTNPLWVSSRRARPMVIRDDKIRQGCVFGCPQLVSLSRMNNEMVSRLEGMFLPAFINHHASARNHHVILGLRCV
jgi:hypothetical protein